MSYYYVSFSKTALFLFYSFSYLEVIRFFSNFPTGWLVVKCTMLFVVVF
jgi:hypothetical protein